METGIIKEFFDDLLVKSAKGNFSLCKGSEEAIRLKKEDYIGKQVQYYLLPSNKAVCVFR